METTERGFGIIKFKDNKGEECSLQESSNVDPEIWLGLSKVTPMQFVPNGDPSWREYPLPEGVHNFTRMALTPEMAAFLIPYLQRFVDTGYFREEMQPEPDFAP